MMNPNPGNPQPDLSERANPARPASVNGKAKGPDWWLMFSKFLRHGTTIASFVPSSPFLARKMLKGIDWDAAKCIVELGAGTGPITSELVKRAKPGTKLVIIEQDADFCNRLRQKFPTADIAQADAAKLDELLAERGIDRADHVISGLPLPSFSADLRGGILASAAKTLSSEGTFRQITNMPWVYFRLYRKYFNDVRFRLAPINFPPAGFYVCRGYDPQM